MDALKNHYKPKVILIYERFKFYSCSQKPSESIADFVAILKAFAHTCDFGTQLTCFVTDLLWICQHTLLAEADLTFNKAMDIATAREAALRDVQTMGGAPVHRIQGHSQVTGSRRLSPAGGTSRPAAQGPAGHHTKFKPLSTSKPKNPCSGCGKMH